MATLGAQHKLFVGFVALLVLLGNFGAFADYCESGEKEIGTKFTKKSQCVNACPGFIKNQPTTVGYYWTWTCRSEGGHDVEASSSGGSLLGDDVACKCCLKQEAQNIPPPGRK